MSFHPVTTEAGGVDIGRDSVLVFGFSGVMISIKSIDVHIGHESSVVFLHYEYIASAIAILPSFYPVGFVGLPSHNHHIYHMPQ